MDLMVFDVLDLDGPKGVETDVQGHSSTRTPLSFKAFKMSWVKCNPAVGAAALPGVDAYTV